MTEPIPTTLDEFSNLKVVFFKETEPLSDKFEQIMLTPDQRGRVFKALNAEMQTCKEQGCECGGVCVITNEKHTYTFPNIQDEYSQEQIDREMIN